MMFLKSLVGAVAATGAFLCCASNASADVACAGHVCWHVTERYEFPPRAHVVVHPDDWHWGPRERFAFREHEGRGYWRGSHWIDIH
jgi:hypothetical protein